MIAAVSLPLLLRTGGRKGHGGTGLGKKGSGCGAGHPRQRLALDLPSSRLPSHCFLNRFAIETYTYRQAGRQMTQHTHGENMNTRTYRVKQQTPVPLPMLSYRALLVVLWLPHPQMCTTISLQEKKQLCDHPFWKGRRSP